MMTLPYQSWAADTLRCTATKQDENYNQITCQNTWCKWLLHKRQYCSDTMYRYYQVPSFARGFLLSGFSFAWLDVFHRTILYKAVPLMSHRLNLPSSLFIVEVQGIVHLLQQWDLLKMFSFGGCTVRQVISLKQWCSSVWSSVNTGYFLSDIS